MASDKDFLRHKIWIIYLILIIIIISMAVGYYEFLSSEKVTLKNILEDLYLTLFSALFTIFVIGIFFELYLRKTNSDIDKKRIIDAIQGDNKMLSMFSHSQRENFIQNNIKSIIGERYGNQLFKRVIKNYLDINLIYREEYKYDVEILELDDDFIISNYKISKTDYYAQNQLLISTKHFSEKKSKISFKVIFAFNEQSLDYWLNDEDVFMREILWIDNFSSEISGLSPVELCKFIKDKFLLKINFFDTSDNEYDEEIIFNTTFINETIKGNLIQGIEVRVSDNLVKKYLCKKDETLFYKAKVFFTIPFNKRINRFYFVIAEPTIHPEFSFKYYNGINRVNYITYFAQKDDTFKISKSNQFNKFNAYSKETIYPRSGIIFFWN